MQHKPHAKVDIEHLENGEIEFEETTFEIDVDTRSEFLQDPHGFLVPSLQHSGEVVKRLIFEKGALEFLVEQVKAGVSPLTVGSGGTVKSHVVSPPAYKSDRIVIIKR